MKVWLVYQEYQADTPDVVGIYRSRSEALATATECRREARAEFGWVVYGDEDRDGNDIAAWDVDVRVEEHEVQPPSVPSRRSFKLPRQRKRQRGRRAAGSASAR